MKIVIRDTVCTGSAVNRGIVLLRRCAVFVKVTENANGWPKLYDNTHCGNYIAVLYRNRVRREIKEVDNTIDCLQNSKTNDFPPPPK